MMLSAPTEGSSTQTEAQTTEYDLYCQEAQLIEPRSDDGMWFYFDDMLSSSEVSEETSSSVKDRLKAKFIYYYNQHAFNASYLRKQLADAEEDSESCAVKEQKEKPDDMDEETKLAAHNKKKKEVEKQIELIKQIKKLRGDIIDARNELLFDLANYITKSTKNKIDSETDTNQEPISNLLESIASSLTNPDNSQLDSQIEAARINLANIKANQLITRLFYIKKEALSPRMGAAKISPDKQRQIKNLKFITDTSEVLQNALISSNHKYLARNIIENTDLNFLIRKTDITSIAELKLKILETTKKLHEYETTLNQLLVNNAMTVNVQGLVVTDEEIKLFLDEDIAAIKIKIDFFKNTFDGSYYIPPTEETLQKLKQSVMAIQEIEQDETTSKARTNPETNETEQTIELTQEQESDKSLSELSSYVISKKQTLEQLIADIDELIQKAQEKRTILEARDKENNSKKKNHSKKPSKEARRKKKNVKSEPKQISKEKTAGLNSKKNKKPKNKHRKQREKVKKAKGHKRKQTDENIRPYSSENKSTHFQASSTTSDRQSPDITKRPPSDKSARDGLESVGNANELKTKDKISPRVKNG